MISVIICHETEHRALTMSIKLSLIFPNAQSKFYWQSKWSENKENKPMIELVLRHPIRSTLCVYINTDAFLTKSVFVFISFHQNWWKWHRRWLHWLHWWCLRLWSPQRAHQWWQRLTGNLKWNQLEKALSNVFVIGERPAQMVCTCINKTDNKLK